MNKAIGKRTDTSALLDALPLAAPVQVRVLAYRNSVTPSAPSPVATTTTGPDDEERDYKVSNLPTGFVLAEGIAAKRSHGSLRFKDAAVHTTRATNWQAAVEKLLVGNADVESKSYMFVDHARFKVGTGAEVGAGSPEGSLADKGLVQPKDKVIGFEDGVDADFNDAYWKLKVTSVDLNVDSNNDGQITKADDRIEDDAARPGKMLPVGNEDRNENGIPDYADGFPLPGVTGNGPAGTRSFAPVELAVYGVDEQDRNRATVSFQYDGSDPAGLTVSDDENGVRQYTPAPGDLRLWTRSGDTPRELSDYLAPGQAYRVGALIAAGVVKPGDRDRGRRRPDPLDGGHPLQRVSWRGVDLGHSRHGRPGRHRIAA